MRKQKKNRHGQTARQKRAKKKKRKEKRPAPVPPQKTLPELSRHGQTNRLRQLMNVTHVVVPILMGDSQLVNNENMSHGQSFAMVTPLEHVARTTLGPKVTTKPRYPFMKCKTMAIGIDDLPLAKKGSTSSHHQMKVNFEILFFEI